MERRIWKTLLWIQEWDFRVQLVLYYSSQLVIIFPGGRKLSNLVTEPNATEPKVIFKYKFCYEERTSFYS